MAPKEKLRRYLIPALTALSTLFMLYVSSAKNFSILLLSLQHLMGVEPSGTHAQILKTTELLANLPLQTYGNIQLENDRGWVFFNGHSRLLLPNSDSLKTFHKAVENGRYLIFRDNTVFEATLPETMINETSNAHDPLHDYWRHVACMNEKVMSLTIYPDLPDITLYDVPVALMVYKYVPWNIETPTMHFAMFGSFVDRGLQKYIPVNNTELQPDTRCYKADQLQKETGMKAYSLWNGDAWAVYDDTKTDLENHIRWKKGTPVEDKSHTVCVGPEVTYEVDEFRPIWSETVQLEGLMLQRVQVTTRFISIVSDNLKELAANKSHLGTDGLQVPFRKIMAIPVDGKVKVRTALVVSADNPLLSLSGYAIGIVMLFMMISCSDNPKRDVILWVNILVESPGMLWAFSLGSIGTLGNAARWLHLASNFNRSYNFDALWLNFSNLAWIMRGGAVISVVAMRTVLAFIPRANYTIAQLQVQSSAIPTVVASIFMQALGKSSNGTFSSNSVVVIVGGLIMAILSYFGNRLLGARAKKNFVCDQVNRRLFTFYHYEAWLLLTKMKGTSNVNYRVIAFNSNWRYITALLIDKSLWHLPSNIAIHDKGGVLWDAPVNESHANGPLAIVPTSVPTRDHSTTTKVN